MTRDRQRPAVAADGEAPDGPDREAARRDEPETPKPGSRAARASRRTTRLPAAEMAAIPIGGITQRRAMAQSRAEAQQMYVAARDAWTAAMKAASSGRAADLAALAIVQEAYEGAVGEWDQWESGTLIAVPVRPDRESSVSAVVDQEIAWRKVHDREEKPGLIGRIARRLGRS
jgi:hypothetical protein